MKKTITVLASVLFFVSSLFISCATNTQTPSGTENNGKNSGVINSEITEYPLTGKNVRLLGRASDEGDVIWMPYSSTGVEFNINAKRLDVSFQGDSGAGRSDESNAARIVVFVNGERKLDEMLMSYTATYTVFDQKEAVTGTVQILKVSEAANSTAGVTSISLDKDGTFKPTAAKALKIEFIGDSITCGYGVDDLDRTHHFLTSTEDNTKTYAYKTAQKLNADYSMVSISGWGIVSGYTGDGNKNSTSILPQYYDKLAYSWGNRFNGWLPQQVDWDFSTFVPDVVVINLGTNDSSYTKGKADRIEEFEEGYIAFLKDIRSKNSEAYIICSLGIMGQDLCSAIDSAVEAYKTETGDEKVTVLKFDNQSDADGIAADWHPSEKTHEKAAQKLTAKIQELGF